MLQSVDPRFPQITPANVLAARRTLVDRGLLPTFYDHRSIVPFFFKCLYRRQGQGDWTLEGSGLDSGVQDAYELAVMRGEETTSKMSDMPGDEHLQLMHRVDRQIFQAVIGHLEGIQNSLSDQHGARGPPASVDDIVKQLASSVVTQEAEVHLRALLGTHAEQLSEVLGECIQLMKEHEKSVKEHCMEAQDKGKKADE